MANLNPDDQFLVGQKDTNTGEIVNRRVSYETLMLNLGAVTAQQITATPGTGRLGYVMPDSTMVYDNISGQLGVNFDSTGFKFAGIIRKNGGEGVINADPAAPPKDSVVGDFWLVEDAGVIVDATNWGLAEVDLKVSTNKGSGYQSNTGTITCSDFKVAALSGKVVLDYVIVDGFLIDVLYDPSKNLSIDMTGFYENMTYIPDFTATLGGSYKLNPILLLKEIKDDGSPVFTVASAGSEIRVGPVATVEDSTLTDVKAVNDSAPEVEIYVDVTLTATGQIKTIENHNYQYGFPTGTKLKVLGHPVENNPAANGTYGELEVTSATPDAGFHTSVNDKFILSKTGWIHIPDEVSRNAVFDVRNAVFGKGETDDDGNDLEGQVTCEALEIGQLPMPHPDDPLVKTLHIQNANTGLDGLLSKELFEKLNNLQDYFGSVDNIEPKLIPTNDQIIAGDTDNPVHQNVFAKILLQEDANGDELPENIIKDIELSITSTRDHLGGLGSDGITRPAGRIEGTTFIVKPEEIVNQADFSQEYYYNAVPNAKVLTDHYARVDAEPYVNDTNAVASVKISGGNQLEDGGTLELTALVDLVNEADFTGGDFKWTVNGSAVADADSTTEKITLSNVSGLTPDALNTIEVEYEGATEVQYVFYKS